MAGPAQIDMIADRNVPFVEGYCILRRDFSGSTFRIQVRSTKDTTGSTFIDGTSPFGVAILYAGTATVAAHVAASRLPSVGPDSIYAQINPTTRVPYVDTDNLQLTQLGTFLLNNTLPYPDERGDDLVAYYDIVRVPASGYNELLMAGKYVVRAGVTIP